MRVDAKPPMQTELLTLSEAARIAGRSYSWARDCATDGRLETCRAHDGRKIQVTFASLLNLLKHERRLCAVGSRRQHIRLVVDNTK